MTNNDLIDKFSTDIDIAWGELDALNHLNGSVYFRHFETAIVKFFSFIELDKVWQQNKIGPVLKDNFAKYIHPVTYPDLLTIEVTVSEIQNDRFTLNYNVHSQMQKRTTTVGKSIIVMIDLKAGISTNIPQNILDNLHRYSSQQC